MNFKITDEADWKIARALAAKPVNGADGARLRSTPSCARESSLPGRRSRQRPPLGWMAIPMRRSFATPSPMPSRAPGTSRPGGPSSRLGGALSGTPTAMNASPGAPPRSRRRMGYSLGRCDAHAQIPRLVPASPR